MSLCSVLWLTFIPVFTGRWPTSDMYVPAGGGARPDGVSEEAKGARGQGHQKRSQIPQRIKASST